MTIIYGLSGIALNHIEDWNPSYIIRNKEIKINPELLAKEQLNKSKVISLMKEYVPDEKFKNYYFPNNNTLKVFIKDGNIIVDLTTGQGFLETSKRRPVFHQFNYLHYDPKQWWTAVSDIYAVSLMILAITGLFILKGKNGITRRGAWLTAIGIVVPILFLMIYYWKIF